MAHTPSLPVVYVCLTCDSLSYVPNEVHFCPLHAAAPDLLAACADLVQAHEVRMDRSAVNLRIDLARAAIAKATAPTPTPASSPPRRTCWPRYQPATR